LRGYGSKPAYPNRNVGRSARENDRILITKLIFYTSVMAVLPDGGVPPRDPRLITTPPKAYWQFRKVLLVFLACVALLMILGFAGQFIGS